MRAAHRASSSKKNHHLSGHALRVTGEVVVFCYQKAV
jgi:hypothetical protein